MASTFITQVQPQLQSDPNADSAALLRVLIYKIDNTTFGSDVPTLPQWIAPPPTVIQAQAILYTSLVISLFSAFLAMLGKQWLNRYASNDTRGSAIERSQDRQRKYDGTVTWCFDFMMTSLPMMLQAALFLLVCALTLYLWGINTTIASVLLGFTLFAVAFYGFIIIAGTASVSCPYQTPHAHVLRNFLRRLLPLFPNMFRSLRTLIRTSETMAVLTVCWQELKGYRFLKVDTACMVTFFFMLPIYGILFPIYFLVIPTVMVYDVCLLTLEFFRKFSNLVHRLRIWLRKAQTSNLTVAAWDLRCISWMLQVSMDKVVHLSALKLLATMTTLVDFSPALVSACFDTLIGCVAVVDNRAVITQESEELAAVSAMCCLRTLSRIAAKDPTLNTIKRVHRRYIRSFPRKTNFGCLPPDHSLRSIHKLLHSSHPTVHWNDYQLLGDDQVTLARTLAQLANGHVSEAAQPSWDVFLRGRRRVKVPRWILRFALHQLSQSPLPPTPIVIYCLYIIAIDLGCNIDLDAPVQDERYVHISLSPGFGVLTRGPAYD